MKCLIIAAGIGFRLRSRSETKPLLPLLGVPLIERVIRSVATTGIREFVVVTGYNGPRVRAFLDDLANRAAIGVTHVENDRWEEANGVSVLAARETMTEPFLLVMSDHLFDPSIAGDLLAHGVNDGETVLSVDYRTSNSSVDLEDVTRVEVEGDLILNIGKGLSTYNAFDTGIFLSTPGLFDAIDQSIIAHKDGSLSGGMRMLAAVGRARAFDIGDRFWLDIDEPDEADTAELLVRNGLVMQS